MTVYLHEDSVMMHRQMHKIIGPKHNSSFSSCWFPENKGNDFAVLPCAFTHSKGALQVTRSNHLYRALRSHGSSHKRQFSLIVDQNDTELIFAMLTIDVCWCCQTGLCQALLNRPIICVRSASQCAAKPATSQPTSQFGERAKPFQTAFLKASLRCPPKWASWHGCKVINIRNSNS